MFDVGDYVVYGGEGVCRVGAVGPLELDGKKSEKLYYTLFPVYVGGTKVYTPVSNDKVVIRAIISKEETEQLIGEMPDMELLTVANEKTREELYRNVLKNCDCREVARLIKTVHSRREKRIRTGKKVTAVDERYYRAAEEQLYGELAIPLSIEKSQVKDYIAACMEKNGAGCAPEEIGSEISDQARMGEICGGNHS